MFGWRGRIGWIYQGDVYMNSTEYDKVLPKGIVWAISCLGMREFVPAEFERVFPLIPQLAERLARMGVGFIALGSPPTFAYMGAAKTKQMIDEIEKSTGVPTMTYYGAGCKALQHLGAKKIVVVNPIGAKVESGSNQFPDMAGLEILNIKGLGVKTPLKAGDLPPYASYQLAREAYRESPQAEAIYIGGPAWEVLDNIQPLEQELGIPVVTAITGVVWAALTAMNFHEPIKGYGRLLEKL